MNTWALAKSIGAELLLPIAGGLLAFIGLLAYETYAERKGKQ